MPRFWPLFIALIFVFASAANAAPPEQQLLELKARTVRADAQLPLPEQGNVYLFAERALTRAQLDRAPGLRYLGLAGPRVYTMQRVGGSEEGLRAWIEGLPILGTALAEAEDRLDAKLLAHYQGLPPQQGEALSHDLIVTLWGGAQVAEVLALIPEAAEQLSLPLKRSAAVGRERSLRLSAVRPARLHTLMAAPVVAELSLAYPRVLFNKNSRAVTHTDAVWAAPYNLDGAGVLIGEWDGGQVYPHADFGGRVRNLDAVSADSHATHVAGTILGAGADEVRGHAPAATLIAGYFNYDPLTNRKRAKHSYYHEHDTHSWGEDPRWVRDYSVYDSTDREFDSSARDLLMLAMKAAGNEGDVGDRRVNGIDLDSLSPGSTEKNALVVGAVGTNRSIAYYSSRGPTEDGRVKPDVMANGGGNRNDLIRSTSVGGGYVSQGGTSMATPAVTGVVSLLAQLYKRLHSGRRWAPDLARAVLIHTADDIEEEGPDYLTGWGIVNAQTAADLLLADVEARGLMILRGDLRDGESKLLHTYINAGEATLKLTLTWLDPAGSTSTTKQLIHDLDLELVSPSGTTYYPYSLSDDAPTALATTAAANTVDNVEQVRIPTPEEGVWTIRVRGSSISDPNLADQGFVLVSSAPITDQSTYRATAAIDAEEGLVIPAGGLSQQLTVENTGTVLGLRVYADVIEDNRGDLLITLSSPSGRAVVLHAKSDEVTDDVFAIFPDTMPASEDIRSFIGEDAAGQWTVRLEDGDKGGVLRNLTLELDLPGNEFPTVSLTATPLQLRAGDELRLQAKASDPDGDPLQFKWRVEEPVEVDIQAGEAGAATARMPRVKDAVTLHINVTANDSRGGVATARSYAVLLGNRAPVVELPSELRVGAGETVQIQAVGRDADGDALSYSWRALSQDSAAYTLSKTDQAEAEVELAEGVETLRLAVAVSDGLDTTEEVVTLVVVPMSGTIDASSCAAVSGATQVSWLLLFGLLLLKRRRRA